MVAAEEDKFPDGRAFDIPKKSPSWIWPLPCPRSPVVGRMRKGIPYSECEGPFALHPVVFCTTLNRISARIPCSLLQRASIGLPVPAGPLIPWTLLCRKEGCLE